MKKVEIDIPAWIIPAMTPITKPAGVNAEAKINTDAKPTRFPTYLTIN